jgi:predicted metal-dependent enzyme (double-stranded beta helix superfamily)
MFDPTLFVRFCLGAIDRPDAPAHIRAELLRIVAKPNEIAPPKQGDRHAWRIHRSRHLTVLHTAYAPSLRTMPHDHGTYAVVSVYRGQEDNVVYKRAGRTLSVSEHQSIRPGEAVVLDADTIHDLSTSSGEPTCSIHVYGGDLFDCDRRTMWIPPLFTEANYNEQEFAHHAFEREA